MIPNDRNAPREHMRDSAEDSALVKELFALRNSMEQIERTQRELLEKLTSIVQSLFEQKTQQIAEQMDVLLPEDIKRIRTERHLTQKEAANIIGISREAWAYLESGKRKPSRRSAILIRLLEKGVIQ